MGKVAVMIMGTNRSGKSSVAKDVAARYGGGISTYYDGISISSNGKIALLGRYTEAGGGVDRMNCTRLLPGLSKSALEIADVVLFEGSMLDTFGNNPLLALSQAKCQLVVLLYAPIEEINRRAESRPGNYGNIRSMASKQIRCLRASKKYASVGIPVMSFDTSKVSTQEISDKIINYINQHV